MYNFPSQSVFILYLSSIAYFRYKAYYFPEYFTPKSSTTKVNFIGRLLYFHSPGGGCFKGDTHRFIGVLPGNHVLSVLLGESIPSICYPFIDVSIVCFFCKIVLFYKFLWYHLNLDHDVFVPVHLVFQVEIFYVHARVSGRYV